MHCLHVVVPAGHHAADCRSQRLYSSRGSLIASRGFGERSNYIRTSEDSTSRRREDLETYLVKGLLDTGADINVLPGPERGTTALQATVDSSLALVRLLLSNGADVDGPSSAAYRATALQ